MANGAVEGRKPIALDGGYGWFIVLCSLLILVIINIFVISFEELISKSYEGTMGNLVETTFFNKLFLLRKFNDASLLLISLPAGLPLVTGPLASALCNRIGYRTTTIIGAVIASYGFVISLIANLTEIILSEMLIISVGIVMGLGFGLMYFPAIVIVTMYFERRRVRATVLTIWGAGVVSNFLSRYIIFSTHQIDRRIVFIIYAVALLCVSLCALCAYRPIKFEPIYADDKKELKEIDLCYKSMYVKDDHYRSRDLHLNERLEPIAEDENKASPCGIDDKKEPLSSPIIATKPTLDSHEKIQATISHAEVNEDIEKANGKSATGLQRTKAKMFDLSLLANPVYLLFAISFFLISIGINTPLIFMALYEEVVINLSITTKSAIEVISSIIGQIVFFLVCNRAFPFKYGKDRARNRLCLYSWSLMIIAVTSAFSFLSQSSSLLVGQLAFASYCFVFVISISYFKYLTSVIVVELVGVDRFTNAFGLLLFVKGIGYFIGPYVCEKIYDITESFYWSFAFSGVCLFLSGIMLFVIPFMKKTRNEVRLENSAEKHSEKPLLH
uniref:Uncharacterized protein n=1 Tax=Acrobeloides nanus TaxID=290746 RepID=A0A914DN44_9BILA